MRTDPQRRSRLSRRSRGAAVLEMVLVAPLLLLLLFGIGEFGLAWVSANKLEGAVSAAARVGSSQGSRPDADRAILMQLRASLPQNLLDNVTRVVIYSSNADGDIAPNCLTNTPPTGVGDGNPGGIMSPDRCNIYSGATLQSVTATFPATLPGQTSHWDPDDRRDTLAQPPDYLGVLVQTRHDDFSGTFWRDGFELERRSIYRIQPDING
jgi:hypothetical protein